MATLPVSSLRVSQVCLQHNTFTRRTCVFVFVLLPPTAVFPSSSTSGLSSLVTLFYSATKQQLIKNLFCCLTSSIYFLRPSYAKKKPQIEIRFGHFEILKRPCRIRLVLCLIAEEKFPLKIRYKISTLRETGNAEENKK
jgi:hypothetical protein